MAQIEFIYKGNTTILLSEYTSTFQNVLQKLHMKAKINLDSVNFVYSGEVIVNKNLTIDKIIKNLDKENNKMIIQVLDKLNNEDENIMIKSKEIICPKCKESAKICINDYKIKIYGCINKHDINDIPFDEYEKSQLINISKVICDECKIKNKGNSYKNTFYRCNTCNINLCPLCNEKHDKEHKIIDYDNKNYICKYHNYSYSSYCKTCGNNLCILCENDHENHEIFSLGKMIPNQNTIKKIKAKMIVFREKIDFFNKTIKEIINKLNKIIDNIEILYTIYDDIIKNNIYNNYENLKNLNDFNVDKYINDLNQIVNDNKINNNFINIMNIYNKMLNINQIEDNNNKNDIEVSEPKLKELPKKEYILQYQIIDQMLIVGMNRTINEFQHLMNFTIEKINKNIDIYPEGVSNLFIKAEEKKLSELNFKDISSKKNDEELESDIYKKSDNSNFSNNQVENEHYENMNKLSINKDIKELNNNKKINDLSCNIKDIFNINFKKDKNSLYFSDYKEQLSLMINDIIRQILYDQVYDQNRAQRWCYIISNKIIEALKSQKSEFRFICTSTILSKGSSAMNNI